MSDPWIILGCGYVGTRLAKRLAAIGARVRVVRRAHAQVEALAALGVEVIAEDLTKRQGMKAALYGLTQPVVVYSVPPTPGFPGGECIRRVGETLEGKPPRAFIYLGSTAVYGPATLGEWVDESKPVVISDADAQPRIVEEGAVELLASAGMRTCILRLAAIYGPGRGVRERLRAGSYQLVDDGAHYFSRIHVDDIVEIVIAAADRAPPGSVYNVGDDRPSTQREYVEWLAPRLNAPLPPSVPSLEPGKRARPVRNRRIANALVKRELGLVLKYPSFVEGEEAIEAEVAGDAG